MPTVQFSVDVRDARADSVEAEIGTTAVLKIFDGTMPANCATADAGTVLATLTLPSDWMAAASSGAIAKTGTWQDASADATGTAQYWRLYESTAATCHAQGDISTVAAGTGSMQMATTTITSGLPFTVASFGWTEGHA